MICLALQINNSLFCLRQRPKVASHRYVSSYLHCLANQCLSPLKLVSLTTGVSEMYLTDKSLVCAFISVSFTIKTKCTHARTHAHTAPPPPQQQIKPAKCVHLQDGTMTKTVIMVINVAIT